MAEPGSGGAIPNVVLGTLTQMNTLLGAGLAILTTYKLARAAWNAARPTADSPFLSDEQLIFALSLDGAKLVAHVDEVLAKFSKPGDTAADTAGDPAGGV